MHPFIQTLAEKYKITISSRLCGGEGVMEPVWNGENLASFWLRQTWDEDGETILACEKISLLRTSRHKVSNLVKQVMIG